MGKMPFYVGPERRNVLRTGAFGCKSLRPARSKP